MNGFGNWLRNLGYKLSTGLARFMAGRYGTDKLNTFLLTVGVIFCIIPIFIKIPVVVLVTTVLSYALMIWVIFRCFSRNTYKRYEENRKFLRFFDRLKDRDHRYFSCPKCRQSVRVPRGKGKIAITCPKCRERFIKRT